MIRSRRKITISGSADLNDLIGAACNYRGGGVNDGDGLAALGRVAAGVGSLPGAGRIEGAAAVAGHIGDGAQHREGHIGAIVIRDSWQVEAPGSADLNDLVGAASDHWRG